jgi:hypothetical protein
MPSILTRSINQLVLDSLKMISLFQEDAAPPAYRISEGIDLLNDLVAQFEHESVLIPYDKVLTFTSTIGKGNYYISPDVGSDVIFAKPCNIAFVEARYNNARYPIKKINDNVYWETFVVENVTGRPLRWLYQRDARGTTLTLHPTPSLPYEILVKGKFGMDEWKSGDIFNTDRAYYRFLQHALAREYVKYYKTGTWNEMMEKDYDKLLGLYKSSNDRDFSMKNAFSGADQTVYKLVNV